jgi:hypothetical protein
MRNTTLSALLAGGALALVAARALAADAPPPPGPGLDLINQRCVFCHSTAQIFSQRSTPEGWAALVQSMAARGAEVDDGEQKVIADYLAKNYPAAAAGAPGGAAPAPAKPQR